METNAKNVKTISFSGTLTAVRALEEVKKLAESDKYGTGVEEWICFQSPAKWNVQWLEGKRRIVSSHKVNTFLVVKMRSGAFRPTWP